MRTIKKVCKEHNISVTDKYLLDYKQELNDVKQIRNNLAHGNISFIAAMKEKSVDDTYKCVKDIIKFLRYLMDKTNKLVNEKSYLNNK